MEESHYVWDQQMSFHLTSISKLRDSWVVASELFTNKVTHVSLNLLRSCSSVPDMEVPDISHLSSNAKRMQTAEAMGWLTCDTALAKSVKLYEVIEAEFVLLATCVSDVEKMCSEFKSISVQITELFHQLVIKRDNQHPHPDFVCATFSWPPLLEELDRMSCRLDNDLKLRSWLVFQLSGYYPTRTRSVNSSNDLISSPKTSSYAVKLHQLSMFSRHLNNLLSWDLLSAMTDNLLHSLDSAP